MEKEVVKWSAMLVVALLGLSILGAVASAMPMEKKAHYGQKVIIGGRTYTTHAVIRINGDGDFNAAHGVISGNGTKDDPYIIAGWDIDANGAGDAIYIGNTTEYFVVRDCQLHNASYQSLLYYEGDGIMLYNVTNAKLENNTIHNNRYYGIYLDSSSGNTLGNNTIYNNSGAGIDLCCSSSNTLANNIIYNNSYGYGIYLGGSNNTLTGNTIYNNEYGIDLYGSSGNTLANNTIYNNSWDGLDLEDSSSNTLANNTIYNNYNDGINMYGSDSNTLANNIIYNNSYGYGIYRGDGIYLGGSNNTLTSNIIYNNSQNGISIGGSRNKLYGNKLTNNGIVLVGNKDTFTTQDIPTNNTVNGKPAYYYKNVNMHNSTVPLDAGQVILGNVSRLNVENLKISNASVAIEVGYSSHITIDNNTIHNNNDGIFLWDSSSNTLASNTIYNNNDGIYLDSSSSNTLTNNTIYNNSWNGIDLEESSSNTLYGNRLNNNGIFLVGNKDTFTTQDIPTNNTVNGKPVYYYKNANMHNASVPLNAGQVILGNVSWLRVENLKISNASVAIEVVYSSNITIDNNAIHNNSLDGIFLWDSSSNTLASNSIYNNYGNGIYLWRSSGNYLTRNKIENSTYYGIYIDSGSNNYLYGNIFAYNYGSNSTYNSSRIQAYDGGSNNHWNASQYGNYWLDWAENNDTNDKNHDGIVDWSYHIAGFAGARDYYPLKNRSTITVPLPPQNLKANIGNGYVNLTWTAPADDGGSAITEYKIYRNGALIATVPASQLWYNDTNVVNGQTYTYYVTAVNSVGESEKSNEVQATPSGSVPEFTPVGIIAVLLFVALVILMRRKY